METKIKIIVIIVLIIALMFIMFVLGHEYGLYHGTECYQHFENNLTNSNWQWVCNK